MIVVTTPGAAAAPGIATNWPLDRAASRALAERLASVAPSTAPREAVAGVFEVRARPAGETPLVAWPAAALHVFPPAIRTLPAACTVLVLVEAPQYGLAAAIDGRAALDVSRWLADWEEGARAIERAIQLAPDKVLAVDLAEASARAPAWAGLLATRLRLEALALPQPEPVSPAAQALARAAVVGDARVRAQAERLRACCLPLGDAVEADREAATPALGTVLADAVAAWRAERDRCLAESRSRASALEAQTRDRAAEAAALRSQLQGLQSELEQQRASARALEARLDAASREADTLRSTAASEKRASEDDRKSAARAAEALQAEVGALKTAAARQKQSLEDERSAAARAADKLRGELKQAEQENDSMLVQLHQVQEELEKHYLGRRNAEDELAAARAAAASMEEQLASRNTLAQRRLASLEKHRREQAEQRRRLLAARYGDAALLVDEVVLGREHLTPPHLGLSVSLKKLRLGAAAVPEAVVRLVEHRGFPGLLVFGVERAAHWLSSWCETGREGDLPYMLLMPTEASSRKLLETLPCRDWLATASLLELLAHALAEPDASVSPAWQQVLLRLTAQLSELPARFRYDELLLGPAAADQGGVKIVFHRALHGLRRFDEVAMRCAPASGGGTLEILCGADGRLPLFNLPLSEESSQASALALPVGDRFSSAEKARRWAALSGEDRVFIAAMLDALAGALASGTAADGLAPAQREAVLGLLHDAARHAAGVTTARRVLRGLSRRTRALIGSGAGAAGA